MNNVNIYIYKNIYNSAPIILSLIMQFSNM